MSENIWRDMEELGVLVDEIRRQHYEEFINSPELQQLTRNMQAFKSAVWGDYWQALAYPTLPDPMVEYCEKMRWKHDH